MKRLTTLGVLVAGMVLLMPAAAVAQPGEPGQGMQPGMMGGMGAGRHMMMQHDEDAELSAEVRMKVLDERISFLKSTATLRNDMAVKQLELRKLWLADKPDYDKILAKSKELVDIRMKLSQKRLEMQVAMRKLMPEGWKPGPGHMGMMGGMHGGMGMMGGGMGQGCGMMGGGMGHGMMQGGMGGHGGGW